MVLRPALNTPLPPISRSSLPQARSLARWGAGWRRPVRHGLWSDRSAEGSWWESGRAAAAGGLKENGGRIEQQRSVEGWNRLESFPLLPQSTGRLRAVPMEDKEQSKDSMKQKLRSLFLLYCDIHRSEITFQMWKKSKMTLYFVELFGSLDCCHLLIAVIVYREELLL